MTTSPSKPKLSFRSFCAGALWAAGCVALLTSLAPSAQAQSRSAGRLSDGRAYRVDENGYQLVDHIAELEVGNLELRQQVAALEAELGKKIPAQQLPDHRPLRFLRHGAVQTKKLPNCNELVSNLYLKISRLEQRAADPNRLPAAAAECDYRSEDNPLWEQIRSLQEELKVTEQRVASLNGELTEARQQTVSAAPAQQPLAPPPAEVETQPAPRSTQRARLESSTKKSVAAARATKGLTESRSDKRELQKELGEIEQLILQRKSAYDELKGQKSSVTVSISPLRTQGGVSLDTLRARINSFGAQSSRAEVDRGLAEIKKILTEDLNVFKRVGRL